MSQRVLHTIRLLGPWQFEWQSVEGMPLPEVTAGTTSIPQDWRSLFDNLSGTASFSRRFHKPSNLETHEHVWLVCRGVNGMGSIALNDTVLSKFDSDGGPVECEITWALKSFNILSVSLKVKDVSSGSSPLGVFDSVVLEIRSN